MSAWPAFKLLPALLALRLGRARRLRLPVEPRLRLVAATLSGSPARPLAEGAPLLP